MTKELHCRDLGFDCDGVVSAETDEEVLAQVAQHGQEVHGLSEEELREPGFREVALGQIRDRDDSE
jgi:predicted small metal-binding protein